MGCRDPRRHSTLVVWWYKARIGGQTMTARAMFVLCIRSVHETKSEKLSAGPRRDGGSGVLKCGWMRHVRGGKSRRQCMCDGDVSRDSTAIRSNTPVKLLASRPQSSSVSQDPCRSDLKPGQNCIHQAAPQFSAHRSQQAHVAAFPYGWHTLIAGRISCTTF